MKVSVEITEEGAEDGVTPQITFDNNLGEDKDNSYQAALEDLETLYNKGPLIDVT